MCAAHNFFVPVPRMEQRRVYVSLLLREQRVALAMALHARIGAQTTFTFTLLPQLLLMGMGGLIFLASCAASAFPFPSALPCLRSRPHPCPHPCPQPASSCPRFRSAADLCTVRMCFRREVPGEHPDAGLAAGYLRIPAAAADGGGAGGGGGHCTAKPSRAPLSTRFA